jgi:hypothetical protein
VQLIDLPRRWEALSFMLPDERRPIFAHDLEGVTRESAARVAKVLRPRETVCTRTGVGSGPRPVRSVNCVSHKEDCLGAMRSWEDGSDESYCPSQPRCVARGGQMWGTHD